MSTRIARQMLLLGLALSLWSVAAIPSVFALLAAYAAGWLAFELPPLRHRLRDAAPLTLWLAAVALAAPGVAFGVRARSELAQREGWFGADARLRDRIRLADTPSIAPPLWAADRPQTWFSSAPGARRLQLQAEGVRALDAEALGRGVFRIDYDPRRDGVPKATNEPLAVQLVADGATFERTLELVRPLAHPRWFCLAPDRTRAAALSEETDELFVLSSRGLERRVPVGDGPIDCAFTSTRTIVVGYHHGRAIESWDVETGESLVRAPLPKRPGRLAVSPSGALLAVALTGSAPELAILHAADLAPQTRTGAPHDLAWLSFGADDATLFAATRDGAAILRLQAIGRGFRETARRTLGRPAVTLERAQNGRQLWAAATDVHAAGHAQLGNHFVQDQLLRFDTASFTLDDRRLTAERSERQSRPGDADRGLSPMGIHEARDGSLWVAFAGSDELWHWRSDRPTPERIDLAPSELFAPHDVAELADGTVLVSSPVSGAFGLIEPGGRQPRVLRVSPTDAQLLERDRPALARRVGERGFYEGTRSGIACQSCHLHADSDETAYNLGDRRLLPTLSVRGLLGTAPYLRDGSYARLRDLDHVAQTLYGGYLRNQAARDETIAAFVGSLPRRASPQLASERNPTAERRGVAAFHKARCHDCHAPPAFTNLAQYPLRLLFPEQAAELPSEETLDTPSLLSVSASAPYLNDGRAATLEAVLVDHNRSNRHGDVRRLSASERSDLLVFLSSL